MRASVQPLPPKPSIMIRLGSIAESLRSMPMSVRSESHVTGQWPPALAAPALSDTGHRLPSPLCVSRYGARHPTDLAAPALSDTESTTDDQLSPLLRLWVGINFAFRWQRSRTADTQKARNASDQAASHVAPREVEILAPTGCLERKAQRIAASASRAP